VRGSLNGTPRQWLLRRATQSFQSDRHGEVVSNLVTLAALAGPGNEFTATLVPQGSGTRLGLDRDGDGYFDASETLGGYNAADAQSRPGRLLDLTPANPGFVLRWEAAPGARYSVQWSTNLPALAATNGWTPLGPPVLSLQPVMTYTDAPPATVTRRFYRVQLEP
jgi:hypothetical protein